MSLNPNDLHPDDLLTPAEVLEYFPQLVKRGIGVSDIGNYRRHFVLCPRDFSIKDNRVSVGSVMRMMKLINYNLKEMIFNFDEFPHLEPKDYNPGNFGTTG